ncbi:MAG TPA: C39 family peptidase [Methylomirabilota bacterium]|jgi:hypothetical protein|nr:C39 family peptidase [Methylomirabilota bacterium]
MTTGLWGVTSGISGATVTAATPPACRRSITTIGAARPRLSPSGVVLEGPEWPIATATHFVPSFAALTDVPYSLRLELSVRVGGAWSPWAAGATLGPAAFESAVPIDALAVDIDVFTSRAPVEAARLRVRLREGESAAVLGAPWMLTLSAFEPSARPGPAAGSLVPGIHIAVPPRSQMDAEAAIANRVCSPTCVAMLLDFWRRPVTFEALIAEMFHPALDLYGVWPAAIRAAGRRGLAGYLLRFPDWPAAAWCLAQGLPIIASIRYGAGELTGAAASQTPGHLIVLTGWDGEMVLANDPAAPSAAQAARRYRLDELERVWLARAGMGFVIFPPDLPLRGA